VDLQPSGIDVKPAAPSLQNRPASVIPSGDTIAARRNLDAGVPGFPYFLLHLFVPYEQRALVLRHLEEQFQQESQDSLLGTSLAKLLYSKRTFETLAWYAWDHIFKVPLKFVVLLAATIAILKKLGVTAIVSILLKKLELPWR